MKFPKRQEGQGLVEYALILVLVAIVVIAILLALGPRIGAVFSGVADCLQGNGCDPANFGGGGYTYSITNFGVGGTTGAGGSCNLNLSVLTVRVTDENGQGVDGVSVTPSISFPGGSESLNAQTTSGGGNVTFTGGSLGNSNTACGSGTATASVGGASRTASF